MNKLLAVVYVCSNIADYGLTVWGVSVTSFEKEVSRIAYDILVNHGIGGLFVYKFGGMVFALAVIAMLAHITRNEPRIKYMAPATLLFGTAVCLIGAWSWLPHIMEYM